MTETERLRAVAAHYRRAREAAAFIDPPHVLESIGIGALANLFDGIAERHQHDQSMRMCAFCQWEWPCLDVRAALAVADALGIEQ